METTSELRAKAQSDGTFLVWSSDEQEWTQIGPGNLGYSALNGSYWQVKIAQCMSVQRDRACAVADECL
jgi:hypothetical protein